MHPPKERDGSQSVSSGGPATIGSGIGIGGGGGGAIRAWGVGGAIIVGVATSHEGGATLRLVAQNDPSSAII
ncbi:hypothetical protein [Sphingomonas crocodyli]|uniref:Uncharacterized protein n=1 Tax=Sphingomonas crocodyli TaxID=1979270 RepID=A0A437MAB3_9SPHN|nr:hypothetical protein [Sphingomonas crocodyli]RVT94597.1 hypothetical protein EOD43_12390 [Sphingomonas crocodyli]